MAKPKKDVGGTTWLGRKNKSRQDEMSAGNRDRVHDWQDRIAFMKERRPRRSADWPRTGR